MVLVLFNDIGWVYIFLEKWWTMGNYLLIQLNNGRIVFLLTFVTSFSYWWHVQQRIYSQRKFMVYYIISSWAVWLLFMVMSRDEDLWSRYSLNQIIFFIFPRKWISWKNFAGMLWAVMDIGFLILSSIFVVDFSIMSWWGVISSSIFSYSLSRFTNLQERKVKIHFIFCIKTIIVVKNCSLSYSTSYHFYVWQLIL